jgi:glycosyltransferase involved in cell wall biosynthesis
MQPLVSIGMPVFNCEKTLNTAVQSILNQTYPNWELILIDDGSTDKTLDIANSYQDSRIRVVTDGKNERLPARLNQAIELSKGKYFARMDGDDVSYPERLQRQVDYLEQHPNIDLLGSAGVNFDRDGAAIGIVFPKQSHAEICARPWANFAHVLHPTWMGQLSWFKKHQYRPNAIRMEDYEIMLRTYQTSCFAALPEILLGYRVTSLSLKKIINGRYHICIALGQKAIAERNWIFAYGIFEHIIKVSIEIFLIGTGVGFKFLPHRTGIPLQASDLLKWRQIWSECSQEDSSS